nr:MAG TPA: hypothetical protein [Caudoviricetes sp.]
MGLERQEGASAAASSMWRNGTTALFPLESSL